MMHDDKDRVELVFNPRKMSVAMVEAELAKHPDLTIDQIKAMLAHEGTQVRPRQGVERALDARLLELAEEAIEAAAAWMGDEAEDAPDEADFGGEGQPASPGRSAEDVAADVDVPPPPPPAPIEEMTDDEITRLPGESIADQVDRLAEAQGVDEVFALMVTSQDGTRALTIGVDGKLEFVDGRAAAQALHGFWVDLMKKWRGDEPEDATSEPPEDDQPDAPAIAANTPLHVTMTNGEVHEGYYMKPQSGAMIRMRDGQDTVIFMPDHSFWVSPSEDEGGD